MKIIKVESCINCPISTIKNDELICLQNKHLQKHIGNVYKIMRAKDYIANWCPLNDSEFDKDINIFLDNYSLLNNDKKILLMNKITDFMYEFKEGGKVKCQK